MRVRPITRSDLPTANLLAHACFRHDPLHAWLYPRWELYPEHVRLAQMIRIRTRFVNKGSLGLVAVTEETDEGWSGKEEITGVAFFERKGKDDGAQKWMGDSPFKKLERFLLGLEASYHDKVVDRAVSHTAWATLVSTWDLEPTSLLGPQWYLSSLLVSPAHQRRGVGGMLVRYGQEIAQEEGIIVTLGASPMGLGLYKKCGFKLVREKEVEEGTGITDNFMIWEPKGKEGMWLEDSGVGDGRAKVVWKEK